MRVETCALGVVIACIVILQSQKADGAVKQLARSYEDLRKDLDMYYPDDKAKLAKLGNWPTKLSQGTFEKVVKVTSGKVVIADYELLRRDFPALASMSKANIDKWLLEHVGWVSYAQVSNSKASDIVSTPFELDWTRTKQAYRPPFYGRGLVFEVPGGLIDAKGVGAKTNPTKDPHGTGLGTVGELLREYAYEKLISMVFAHSGSGFRTTGTYAIFDWGNMVTSYMDANECTSYPDAPAGALLRQSTPRNPSAWGSLYPETHPILAMETVLRKYGITAAGAYHNTEEHKWAEGINFQGTLGGELVDFGHYLVIDNFTRPVLLFPHLLRGGQQARTDRRLWLMWPGSENFVVPDPKYRVPFSVWNYKPNCDNANQDSVYIQASEIAQKFHNGEISRKDVERWLESLLDPVRKILFGKESRKSSKAEVSAQCVDGECAQN